MNDPTRQAADGEQATGHSTRRRSVFGRGLSTSGRPWICMQCKTTDAARFVKLRASVIHNDVFVTCDTCE